MHYYALLNTFMIAIPNSDNSNGFSFEKPSVKEMVTQLRKGSNIYK